MLHANLNKPKVKSMVVENFACKMCIPDGKNIHFPALSFPFYMKI